MDSSNLPQALFEPFISRPVEIDRLGDELSLCFMDTKGPCEIKTCYGDIYKIVNVLRDNANLLEMVCDQWGLTGFHLATYEYHAEKPREIAGKYQADIGYDYDAAVEKCRKKKRKPARDEGVGEDAMVLAVRKAQRDQAARENEAAKAAPAEAGASSGTAEEPAAAPWAEDGYDYGGADLLAWDDAPDAVEAAPDIS